jgi:hypothetical protein
MVKEANEGMRRHKLMPTSLKSKIPKLYATDGEKDKTIYVKYFSPYSNWTWYVAEFDGKDTFFGYVVGQDSEWGYFSLKELSKVNKDGLPLVERDLYFDPIKFSKLGV